MILPQDLCIHDFFSLSILPRTHLRDQTPHLLQVFPEMAPAQRSYPIYDEGPLHPTRAPHPRPCFISLQSTLFCLTRLIFTGGLLGVSLCS